MRRGRETFVGGVKHRPFFGQPCPCGPMRLAASGQVGIQSGQAGWVHVREGACGSLLEEMK